MNSYTNIIGSKLVPAHYDVFWEDVPPFVNDLLPKPVLIVVHDHEPNGPEGLQLKRIIDRSKLQPEQYNLVVLKDGQQIAWRQLREKLHPKFILMFGIMPSRLGISSLFRANEPNRFNDRIWLLTYSLSELIQSDELKKQLWNGALRPVFELRAFGDY